MITPDTRVDEIRDRADRATAGPWSWFGNVDNDDVYLATVHNGRRFVLRTIPVDRVAHEESVDNLIVGGMSREEAIAHLTEDAFGCKIQDHHLAVQADQHMRPLTDFAIFEVCPDAETRDDRRVYRADFHQTRHPDAEFIAHARADIDFLLDEVERLRETAGIVDLVADDQIGRAHV